MKKHLLSFLLLLIMIPAATYTYAQQPIYVGARAGLSIPNLTNGTGDNPLSKDYKSKMGLAFGVIADFPINKWFSIQTGLDYSQQGGKRDGMQAITNPYPSQIPQPYLYADFKNEARLNYLQLPVQAKFNYTINDHFGAFIYAGPYAGLLLAAKTVTKGSSALYMDANGQYPMSSEKQSFDQTTDIKDNTNLWNFGLTGMIGISYKVPGGKVFIEGGGNYGFINIQKHESDGKNYTGAGTVQIGYAYALNCHK
jgi:opacity protein-like surface antigen